MDRKIFFKQLTDLLKADADKDCILCSIKIFETYFKGAVKIDKNGYNYMMLNDKKIVIWSSVFLPYKSEKGTMIDAMFLSMNSLMELYDKSLKPIDPKGEFKSDLHKISDLYSQTLVRPPIVPR